MDIKSGTKDISWDEFCAVELRIGTVIKAEDFPEARRPALKVWADFGPEYGVLKSSAQITKYYDKDSLPGKKIVGVLNLGKRQIGPFVSDFLVTGFADESGEIVLAVPDSKGLNIPDGTKLL